MDRINWVTSECFQAIAQLSRAHASSSEPALVYERMRAFLDAAHRRGVEAGYAETELRQLGYALTALADEVAMAHDGPLRAHWSKQSLQLARFGDNVAGERFFEELEQARQVPRLDVVRTYYLCLLFGFRGRYGVRGGEAGLAELLDGVRAQLARSLATPELLSPDGARPGEGFVEVSRKLPWPVLALAALALSGVVHLGCRVALREQLVEFSLAGQSAREGGAR
jgi:type VI secretion system protein ImpK